MRLFPLRILPRIALLSLAWGALNTPYQAAWAQTPGTTTAAPASDLVQGAEVLSDTQGVDFSPYIKNVLQTIRQRWVPLIPAEARPPANAKGATLIRFTIGQDGTLRSMHLDGSTHDDAINRSAWGAITGVAKYPPLPASFTGPGLELRIKFTVNNPSPEAPDLLPTAPARTGPLHP